MALTPKNWASFQHYKDRSPPWIKLHHVLLDNFEFHCLPIASRALAPCIWLLASEFEGGKITLASKALAFRLHLSETELTEAVKPLIDGGFMIDDSNMLATCKQDARPETEREAQVETQVRKGKTPQKGFSPSSPEEPLSSALEGKANGSAHALASALPSGALACSPGNEPAEPKPVAEKKPGLYRKPTDDEANDYRSPPPRKSDNTLEPIPERPPFKRP